MHYFSFQAVVLTLILSLFSLGTGPAAIKPPFEVTYAASNVSTLDGKVSFLLKITLLNRSAGEVHYGLLRVFRTSPEPNGSAEPLAEFTGISLPLSRSADSSESVVLSTAEYDQWTLEQALDAEIEWTDDNGLRRSARVSVRQNATDTQH